MSEDQQQQRKERPRRRRKQPAAEKEESCEVAESTGGQPPEQKDDEETPQLSQGDVCSPCEQRLKTTRNRTSRRGEADQRTGHTTATVQDLESETHFEASQRANLTSFEASDGVEVRINVNAGNGHFTLASMAVICNNYYCGQAVTLGSIPSSGQPLPLPAPDAAPPETVLPGGRGGDKSAMAEDFSSVRGVMMEDLLLTKRLPLRDEPSRSDFAEMVTRSSRSAWIDGEPTDLCQQRQWQQQDQEKRRGGGTLGRRLLKKASSLFSGNKRRNDNDNCSDSGEVVVDLGLNMSSESINEMMSQCRLSEHGALPMQEQPYWFATPDTPTPTALFLAPSQLKEYHRRLTLIQQQLTYQQAAYYAQAMLRSGVRFPSGQQQMAPNNLSASHQLPNEMMSYQLPTNQNGGGQNYPTIQTEGYPSSQMAGQLLVNQMGGQFYPTNQMGGQFYPTNQMGGQFYPTNQLSESRMNTSNDALASDHSRRPRTKESLATPRQAFKDMECQDI